MRLPLLVSLAALTAALSSCSPGSGQLKVNPKDGQRYAWIPPGTFTMGCSPGDPACSDDEKPSRQVTITKGFWIGQTPVTVGTWKRYRSATGNPALPASDSQGRKLNEAGGDDNLPAVFVTWVEARRFCGWAGYRLPTEAEWEYAARAGTNAALYGNLNEIAWYADNSGLQRIDSSAILSTDENNYFNRLYDNGNGPHPVGRKQPNTWNLYDMLGNVWQWTADWYDGGYYGRGDNRDPEGPPRGQFRVLRGGSWSRIPWSVRVSARNRNDLDYRGSDFGFRCAGG